MKKAPPIMRINHFIEKPGLRRQFSDSQISALKSTAFDGWFGPPSDHSPNIRAALPPKLKHPIRSGERIVNMKERAAFAETVRETDALSKLMGYQDQASSIPREEISLEYLPELAPVIACLGEDLCESRVRGDFYQARAVHNLEFTLYVALRALEYLNESNKRWNAWSGAPPANDPSGFSSDIVDEYWRLSWMRTTFRCVLCMPIGYIVSQTEFRAEKSGAPTWSPELEDMKDYLERWGQPNVSLTDFIIDPREVSLLTYTRLFGAQRHNVPMLGKAEADFFSDRPNKHNPIWQAYRRAIGHIMAGRRFLAVPYWWAYAINHEYIADPDFLPLTVELQCRDDVQIAPGIDEPEEPVGEVTPHSELVQPPPATIGNPILDHACARARELFESGHFYANRGGCVYQGVSGGVGVVVPSYWGKLADFIGNPSLTAEALHTLFADHGLLDGDGRNTQERHFAIMKSDAKRRLGKCRILPLSPYGISLLFPNGVPFGDNPDLSPMEQKPRASAA